MSQGSLFDASGYIQKAYDQLVLAYNAAELEEIAAVKQAVLRSFIGVREQAYEQLELPALDEVLADDSTPF